MHAKERKNSLTTAVKKERKSWLKFCDCKVMSFIIKSIHGDL